MSLICVDDDSSDEEGQITHARMMQHHAAAAAVAAMNGTSTGIGSSSAAISNSQAGLKRPYSSIIAPSALLPMGSHSAAAAASTSSSSNNIQQEPQRPWSSDEVAQLHTLVRQHQLGSSRTGSMDWGGFAEALKRTRADVFRQWYDIEGTETRNGPFAQDEDDYIIQRVLTWKRVPGERVGLWVITGREMNRKDKRLSERWRNIICKRVLDEYRTQLEQFKRAQKELHGRELPYTPIPLKTAPETPINMVKEVDDLVNIEEPPEGFIPVVACAPLPRDVLSSIADDLAVRALKRIKLDQLLQEEGKLNPKRPACDTSDSFADEGMATGSGDGDTAATTGIIASQQLPGAGTSTSVGVTAGRDAEGVAGVDGVPIVPGGPAVSRGKLLSVTVSGQPVLVIHWTQEMDQRLFEAYGRYGKDWNAVAQFVGYGTDNTKCRRRYERILEKAKRDAAAQGLPPPEHAQIALQYQQQQKSSET